MCASVQNSLKTHPMLVRLAEERLLTVIRAHSAEDAHWTASLLLDCGLGIVEIPWTVPDADQVMAALRREKPDAIIAAGTVLTMAQAEASLAAGAAFLVSPVLDPELVRLGKARNILVLPGVMTPTEIHQAMIHGATAVKFFPAEAAGGVPFVQAIRSLLLPVQIIPTGNVRLEHLAGYWAAGCPAVGVGGDMLPAALIRNRDEAGLRQRIQAYLDQRRQEAELNPLSPRDTTS